MYVPWLPGEETRETFRYDRVWTDPDGMLSLSQMQIESGAVWKRPKEFLSTLLDPITGENMKPVMIHKITPMNITQDLVTDCSFVASLCIAAAFEQKFKKPLITNIIYPQNSQGIPIYNGYGKYIVKLFVNGVQRKVVVDDYLPVSPSGNLLCSCSSDPRELWVSIVEKAYLKVHGGYDFPGSNSGIDLYALTGWIPEQLFFEEDNTQNSSSMKVLDHRQVVYNETFIFIFKIYNFI